MATAALALPDDIDALKAIVSSMRVELTAAEARAAAADALVTHLKQQIALLRRDKYGASAERSQRLADQLELRLDELEADAGEDEVVAELATPATDRVTSFERKRLARKPFPAHLPRERIVVPAPCACPSCGGERLSKLGEDVTETLEVVPRRWKVIQTVRERFSCRDQVAWTVAHLKAGGTISDVSLWLAGIDRPMRLLARAKSALLAEGLTVTGIMRNIADANGQTHDILTWSVKR